MLSRTADHLYWMSRYTERAENIARFLDVNLRMSLMPVELGEGQTDPVVTHGWQATLAITGLEDAFQSAGHELRPERVLEYMVFDRNNPSSIYSCLRAARENAHAVRGTITADMWETTNATWLKFRDYPREQLQGTAVAELFDWVKFRSHLTRGVAAGTLLRDEAWHFMRIGTFIERADSTARFLDVNYQILEDGVATPSVEAEYYQWSALLMSVSALEMYRKVFSDKVSPSRAADLLVFNQRMPRSLASCMREVYQNLCKIKNNRSQDAQRRAGGMSAALEFGRIEDVMEEGMHEYLTGFINSLADLGLCINNDYLSLN